MTKENFPIGWEVEIVGNTQFPEATEYPQLVGTKGEIIGTIPPSFIPLHRLMVRLFSENSLVNVLPREIRLINDDVDRSGLT